MLTEKSILNLKKYFKDNWKIRLPFTRKETQIHGRFSNIY